jgi:hypothetical protein
MPAYDHAHRRRAVRRGRERGCWVYIPAEELQKAERYDADLPPRYRLWARPRGSVVIRLYRESDHAEQKPQNRRRGIDP